MRVSTEFPMWAKQNIDSLRDKQVLMYCTGGIRCERASDSKPLNILGRCCGCKIPWDKYRGKRRCPICGVPLLLCMDCQQLNERKFKCTLCQEDDELGRKPFNKKEHYRQVAEEILEVDPVAKVPVVKKKAKSVCGVCSEEFTSRNALFRHLSESGHHNRRAKKKK